MALAPRYWDTDATITWMNADGTWTGDNRSVVLALPRQAISASGNTATFEQTSLKGLRFQNVYVDVTAVTGTLPTMDAVYQTSPDKGATWYDHPDGVFAQLATTGREGRVINSPGKYWRIKYDLDGTTPVFTMGIDVQNALNTR